MVFPTFCRWDMLGNPGGYQQWQYFKAGSPPFPKVEITIVFSHHRPAVKTPTSTLSASVRRGASLGSIKSVKVPVPNQGCVFPKLKINGCFWFPLIGGRWHIIPPIGSIYHLYTTYILPSGGLYATVETEHEQNGDSVHDKYWIWIVLERDMHMIQLRVNLDLQ